jgi:hypothetical protein
LLVAAEVVLMVAVAAQVDYCKQQPYQLLQV